MRNIDRSSNGWLFKYSCRVLYRTKYPEIHFSRAVEIIPAVKCFHLHPITASFSSYYLLCQLQEPAPKVSLFCFQVNNFARNCYPVLSSIKAMFRKKKSVKKETQKPQNRHDDEDRTTKEKVTKFLLRTLKFSKVEKK